MYELTVSGFWVKPEGFSTCILLLFGFLRSSVFLCFDFDEGDYFFLRFLRGLVTASHLLLYPQYFLKCLALNWTFQKLLN